MFVQEASKKIAVRQLRVMFGSVGILVRFCVKKLLNFRYRGNKGRSGGKFKDTVKLVVTVNPRLE